MNEEIKLDNFYKNWLKTLPLLNESYIYADHNSLKPVRHVFSYFKKIINDFLNDKLNELDKVILLPGIRGVGKTTLLMQILKIEKFLDPDDSDDAAMLKNFNKLDYRFYFDVSKFHLERISLNDFFKFFEKANGLNFIGLNKKIIILLDEVHFDAEWSLFLKTLFDSAKGNKNLLVIATGSSAINIKMSADLMRRSKTIELFPMKFDEYLILKHGIRSFKKEEIIKAVFGSQNAKEVFNRLKKEEAGANRFFANLPPGCEDEYFMSGGFPFAVGLANKVEIAERIKNVINGIIMKDMITLKKFKTETIGKIYDLLYLLANSDLISYNKLQASLGIENIRTLSALLEVLAMSGILVKVKSYGRAYGATRKTPKYFFTVPSLRSAILDNNYAPGVEGKKLEDYFSLIFVKDLKKSFAYDLRCDTAEGGADFALILNDRSNIIVEVGFNKEEVGQAENTLKKTGGKYGLVFGSNKLELVGDSIVKIPLRFLLLV